MTDNPTPNDIALLREALKPFADLAEQIARERPGWDHDGFTLGMAWPPVAIRMADLRRAQAALALGQHDGAAGEGLTIPAGMKAWAGGDSAPADIAMPESEVICRDGHRYIATAQSDGWRHKPKNNPLWYRKGDIIAYTPKPSTEQARAEGYVLVPRKPTKAMEDAFYDAHASSGTIFASVSECWFAMLDASATPSGADALGDGL